jgi:hypothetical protein
VESLIKGIIQAGTEIRRKKINRRNADKKEKKFFLVYKEIQIGAVAKSCMRKGFLIYEEIRKYLVIL